MSTNEDLEKLSNLYTLQNLMTNLSKNLGFISSGNQGTVITVNGGSLFQLASKYYGNATLWTNIATANGLVDPKLPPGVTLTLVIPNQTKNDDGIYIT